MPVTANECDNSKNWIRFFRVPRTTTGRQNRLQLRIAKGKKIHPTSNNRPTDRPNIPSVSGTIKQKVLQDGTIRRHASDASQWIYCRGSLEIQSLVHSFVRSLTTRAPSFDGFLKIFGTYNSFCRRHLHHHRRPPAPLRPNVGTIL